ncbi:toxin-antitoxin system protein [Raoultella ornithinolytica]|nr:toxin-antitoxin system protein [Raoultella ornithinolytica]
MVEKRGMMMSEKSNRRYVLNRHSWRLVTESVVNPPVSSDTLKRAVRRLAAMTLDQRVFVLEDASYQSFLEQLEAPVQNVEGRQRLMDVKPEWK